MNKFNTLIALMGLFFLALALTIVSCKKEENKNNSPVIESISISPDNITPGTSVQLNCIVTDKDGDIINYNWLPEIGEVSNPNSQSTTWMIPSSTSTNKTFKIELTVSDGFSTSTKTGSLRIKNGIRVKGNIYFKYTKIPVVGATVTIGEFTSKTDDLGYYEILNIANNTHDIKVSKDGFENELLSEIISNSNNTFDFYLHSDEFTKSLYGIAQASDGLPIPEMEISVLNPDGTNSELTTMTNNTGEYQIDNIPIGDRIILVVDKNDDLRAYLDEIQYEITLGSTNYSLNPEILVLRTISVDVLNTSAWSYITPGQYELQTNQLVLYPDCELDIEIPYTIPEAFKSADKSVQGTKQVWLYYYFGVGNSHTNFTCYADNQAVGFSYWSNPYADDYRLYKTNDWMIFKGSKVKFHFGSSSGGVIRSVYFKGYF